ncbi:MAG: LysM peptidoglycan-binding domain-containing protein [Nitrospirae bacterium]|jgi:nucleoid-associated protein YgaU|nr:LysM peptidoglycan-binding domain-containing protein [Nitrospirota bacterium]
MISIKVKKGDCLIKICNSYLENPKYWKKITRINRLKNYNFILPGQTLSIPANMIKGISQEGTVNIVNRNTG